MIKQKKILLSLALGVLIAAPSAQAWTTVSHNVNMNSSGANVSSTAMGYTAFPLIIRNFVNVNSRDKPNVHGEYGADTIYFFPGQWYHMAFSSDPNSGRGAGYSNTTIFTSAGIVSGMGTMIDTSNFAPNESEQDYQQRVIF